MTPHSRPRPLQVLMFVCPFTEKCLMSRKQTAAKQHDLVHKVRESQHLRLSRNTNTFVCSEEQADFSAHFFLCSQTCDPHMHATKMSEKAVTAQSLLEMSTSALEKLKYIIK